MNPKVLGVLLIGVFIINKTSASQGLSVYKSENLEIVEITDSVYRHVTYLNTKSFGKYPCNGLIYISSGKVIIFDSPINDISSLELINWINEKNIVCVVASHFHVDCVGGIEPFNQLGIPVYASEITKSILVQEGYDSPIASFQDSINVKLGIENVSIRFFGEGHTKGNIIGYIHAKNVLFGGCLIKSIGASKGNLDDANLNEWSYTVSNVKRAFPNVEWVVPGHGDHGGYELLDYTIELFEE